MPIRGFPLLVAVMLLAVSVDLAAQGCPNPEDSGPYDAGWRSVTVQRGTRSMSCRVYYPAISSGQNAQLDTSGGKYPMIAFGHGFLAQATYYVSYFEHLATKGYISIAPQFPDTQHGELALDLLACLQYLRDQHSTASSFLYRVVDTSRAGVSGHSMGGGACLLAASYDSRVRIAAPLAPAETTPSAISAMTSISGAVCLITGGSDGITPPAQHQWPMYNAAAAFKSLPLLKGGNHTRFMDTPIGDWTDPNGTMTRPTQQRLARRFMTAAFDLFLKEDTCGWNYSYGMEALADTNVTLTKATKYVAPRSFFLYSPLTPQDPTPPPFLWQRARTLNPRDTVTYTLQYAQSNRFASIVAERTTTDTAYSAIPGIGPGTWFWRVVARNSSTTATTSMNVGEFVLPAIPVELSHFGAERHDRRIRLTWSTASETNNAGFEVECSQGGNEFLAVGFVPGHGTTAQSHDYSFEDMRAGNLRYRLRQLDNDGSSVLSPVVTLAESELPRTLSMAAYPEPVRADLSASLTVEISLARSEDVSLSLFDAQGRRISVLRDAGPYRAGSHVLSIRLPALLPGAYYLLLQSPSSIVSRRMVVVR